MTDFLEPLRCPLCGGSLERAPGCLRCAAGHSYDLARAGYVNLLPPGKKNNAKTGDEKEMIRARSEFLRRGFYDPIDEALASLLAESGPASTDGGDRPFRVADMGAGEGTHSCRIAALLAENGKRRVDLYGFDASKHGAEAGCRLARSMGLLPKDGIAAPAEEWMSPVRAAILPGNIFRLPLADASMDAALSLFAPVPWDEAARILVPGGRLAVVSAGREHLGELRRILYDGVRLTDFHPAPPDGSARLRFLGRRTLSFPVTLSSREEIAALFMMTPFWHRVGDAGRERLAALDALDVTAEAEISLWEAVS
jgi:23S rRNA (guanine745-N1)-methyltransferase